VPPNRRVVLVGSLAVPLSGALLWSLISPVSASSSFHSTSQTSAIVTQTVKVDHSNTGITLRRGSTVTDNASLTVKVTSKVATTASTALAASKKLVPTKVPTRPVTRATAPVARISNPQANIAPSPNFLQAGQCSQLNGAWTCANPCVTPQLSYPVSDNSPACTSYLLLAINNARAIEVWSRCRSRVTGTRSRCHSSFSSWPTWSAPLADCLPTRHQRRVDCSKPVRRSDGR